MAQFSKTTRNLITNNRSIFEVVMLADQYGNPAGTGNPSGMAVDAFGRARTSQPFTLFDSSHRYKETSKFYTTNSATGTYSFASGTSTSNVCCSMTWQEVT